MKREQIIEKFLRWLLRQRFMEMVETIGVDGIAKKYCKEIGEDKAFPLDVPSDEEIKKTAMEYAPVYYWAETNDDMNAQIREEVEDLLKNLRDEIIQRNREV